MLSRIGMFFYNISYKPIFRKFSKELENRSKLILRYNVRKMYWLLQPYRNFSESRKTIYKTEKTIYYIYNLPIKANKNYYIGKKQVQHMWYIYANYPFSICGSILTTYWALSGIKT
tara:strand:+ start:25462 stop:25809 length:348 start_codon:yes stop_codon:yes gene_type:complete